MPTTYTPIATTTLNSTATEINFPTISGAYTDLVLVSSIKPSDNANPSVLIQFNNDTATNYSLTRLKGNGTAASSSRRIDKNFGYLSDDGLSASSTNTISTIITQFQNYSNSTTYKTFLSRSNTPDLTVEAIINLWRSKSAITSMKVYVLAGGFAAGSTFSLYGVSSVAVVAQGAKATGGDTIATDGTYWYHAFRASGTFTPTQALTANVLVVAGGGAGGARQAGGGGAGGVFYATSQSLTTTGYTVTVGAGGAGSANSSINGANGSNSVFGSLTPAVGGGGGQGNGAGGSSGNSGGCGGGANNGFPSNTNTGGTSTQTSTGGTGHGFAGGNSLPGTGAGGGGGAGAVGQVGQNTPSASGGVGVSTYSAWGAATGTGQNVSGTYYYAGGGGAGGGGGQAAGPAGYGGGGKGGANNDTLPDDATVNTGGGGGGGTGGSFSWLSGSGGSGIIIVRYPV